MWAGKRWWVVVTVVLGVAGAAQAGLLAHWAFDDAGNVGLDSVTGTSLTAAGNAQQTAGGHSGGGLLLDGSGDYLHGSPAVPTGNSAYTTSVWIKPDTSRAPAESSDGATTAPAARSTPSDTTATTSSSTTGGPPTST